MVSLLFVVVVVVPEHLLHCLHTRSHLSPVLKTQTHLYTDSHLLQSQPLLPSASFSFQPWPSLCALICKAVPAMPPPERDHSGLPGQSSLSPPPSCPVGTRTAMLSALKCVLDCCPTPLLQDSQESRNIACSDHHCTQRGCPGESLALSRPSEPNSE